ncbi:MAG: ATP-binding protein [Thermoplasmata archaeon]
MENIGVVYDGNTENIKIRLKPDVDLKLGELIVVEDKKYKIVYKVVDIQYQGLTGDLGSEIISGNVLNYDNYVVDDAIYGMERIYKKVIAIPLIDISGDNPKRVKVIPGQFSKIRKIDENDLEKMKLTKGDLFLGYIRNGDEYIKNFKVKGDPKYILTHHIFIVASTGRGKSNATKVMIKSLLDSNSNIGIFTIDPHNEYYEIFKNNENVSYYSNRKIRGAKKIEININKIKPEDLENTGYFNEKQIQTIENAYKKIKNNNKTNKIWLELIFDEKYNKSRNYSSEASIRRKFESLFNADLSDGFKLYKDNIFIKDKKGKDSIDSMEEELEDGKVVILDSSNLDDMQALLLESMVANRIYNKHLHRKNKMEDMNNVVFVLEEARGVLSKKEDGYENIFMKIAREGRKFNIGLIAISQLISPIRTDILTNMNTFIIMGLENSVEINKLFESVPSYLEMEKSIIRSLGKGEAIISSIFFDFPIPVYFPKIEEFDNERKRIKIFGGKNV